MKWLCGSPYAQHLLLTCCNIWCLSQEDDLDEDALLGGSDEEAEYINTLTHEADSTTYDEQIVGRVVKEEPETSREYIELQLPDECDEDFDEE